MFSKYSEVSKIILDYVNESLQKPMMDISILNKQLQEKYGFSLSDVDSIELKNKIDSAKNTRRDYQMGINNQSRAITDWANALDKAKDLASNKEGEARSYSSFLAKKICIGSYKGPLTISTMRELKENGYDGTYGSTTMIQMYSLYNQNQKLEEESKNKDAIIVKNTQQIAQYEAGYRDLFINYQNRETQNSDLKNENARLQNQLGEQNKLIASLSEKIDHLSEKLSVQIINMLKSMFQQQTYKNDQNNVNKTM